MRIVSIQVGLPQKRIDGAREWRSAIDKRPVAHAALSALGLAGDGQADHRYHGGPERAVLAFCAEHYPIWRKELRRPEFAFGSFGENLTVSGLSESEACIGDVYAQGEARMQVSQPRVPCVKLERHLGVPGSLRRALETGRTGVYLRVLAPGTLEPGELAVLERPFPGLTVAVANEALQEPLTPAADALRACPLLSDGFRAALEARAERARFFGGGR